MDTTIVHHHILRLNKDTVQVSIDHQAITDAIDLLRTQSLANTDSLIHSIQSLQDNSAPADWASNGIVFAVLTGLFVFVLAALIGYWRRRSRKNENDKLTRRFFKHHLDQVVGTYSTSLTGAYKNYAHSTTVDTGIVLTPPKVLSNDFERLLHMDSQELFAAISDKESLSKIISNIDLLNQLRDEAQSYHAKALNRSEMLRHQINENLDGYLLSLADLVDNEKIKAEEMRAKEMETEEPNAETTEAEITEAEATEVERYEHTEPYQTINQSLLLFHNELNGTRELLMTVLSQIIRPNQEFLVNEGFFSTHPQGRDIVIFGRNLIHLIDDLKQLIQDFKAQYLDFAKQTDKAIKEIQTDASRIDWKI